MDIILREHAIRWSCDNENEVTTHFDFVMFYLKTWKLACQNKIGDKDKLYYATYKFLCDVEMVAYDYIKSLLIDVESLRFSPSLSVAAIVSASIEIYLMILSKQNS